MYIFFCSTLTNFKLNRSFKKISIKNKQDKFDEVYKSKKRVSVHSVLQRACYKKVSKVK